VAGLTASIQTIQSRRRRSRKLAAIAEGESEQSKILLNELMSYRGIAEVWQSSSRTTQNIMLLTVHPKRGI
jgi:hypothetical protein